MFSFARAADGAIATAETDGIVLRDRNAHSTQRLTTGAAMHAVAFTPSFVIGGGDDGRIYAWPRTGGDATTLTLAAPITVLAAASDGKIAIGTATGTVTVWAPPAAATSSTVELGDRIERLAVDHAGRVIILADHQAALWQPRDGAVLKLSAADNGNEFDISISADDRWLSFANGREARIVDRSSAATPLVYMNVDSVAVSPAGRLLALAQRDGLLLHDLTTGIDIKLPLFRNASSVRFDGNERLIVGGVDGEVYVFDLVALVPATTWSAGGAVRAVRAAADGKTLAAFTLDRKVVELDIGSSTPTVLTLDGKVLGMTADAEPRTWLFATDHGIVRARFETRVHEPVITNIRAAYCLGLSADVLVYSEPQQGLHVRTLASGDDRTFERASAMAECELDADGTLVVGDRDGTVRRIDVATGAILATDHGHTGLVSRIALLPDHTIVTSSTDGTAQDLARQREVRCHSSRGAGLGRERGQAARRKLGK